MTPPEKWTTKLTVTRCDVHKEGVGQNDKPYTIYSVDALTESGEPLTEQLRAFDSLPLGELREYEVKPYAPEGAVQNYTLSLKRPKLGVRVGDLEDRVERLEKAFAAAGLAVPE